MEVVLEAKDALDWIYKGEGGANLVLAYNGSSPQFVGKILRIQKVQKNGYKIENGLTALTMHECLLWKEFEDIVLAPTRELAEQMYVEHVMSPLLGSEHVDAGIRVLVTQEFMESVERNVLCQRPFWRVDAAKVNTQCDFALLIADHSVFPGGNYCLTKSFGEKGVLKEEFCLSVEIKPKCGFLPFSSFIAEENIIKKSTSRFKMHQSLKFHQEKLSQVSEYDPLDMFSGSIDGVRKAIKSLFVTPQNNFRVFLNGSLVFGEMGGGTDFTSCLTEEAFEDVLKCVILADDGLRTTNFLQLVAEAVLRSGTLDRLLEAQKLDIFDIEGVIHAYYDILSQPCLVCEKFGGNELSDRYSPLHSIPLDESLKIVRDYMISATAKDLSLMISLRPRQEGDVGSSYSAVSLESTHQSFDYKASFIDLDMKPLKKMVHYYELDQKIVSCYSHMVKIKHQANNVASIEETSYRDQSRALDDASHTRDSADAKESFWIRSSDHYRRSHEPRLTSFNTSPSC